VLAGLAPGVVRGARVGVTPARQPVQASVSIFADPLAVCSDGTAIPARYALSLHDALPILLPRCRAQVDALVVERAERGERIGHGDRKSTRLKLVCRPLLEKKNANHARAGGLAGQRRNSTPADRLAAPPAPCPKPTRPAGAG